MKAASARQAASLHLASSLTAARWSAKIDKISERRRDYRKTKITQLLRIIEKNSRLTAAHLSHNSTFLRQYASLQLDIFSMVRRSWYKNPRIPLVERNTERIAVLHPASLLQREVSPLLNSTFIFSSSVHGSHGGAAVPAACVLFM